MLLLLLQITLLNSFAVFQPVDRIIIGLPVPESGGLGDLVDRCARMMLLIGSCVGEPATVHVLKESSEFGGQDRRHIRAVGLAPFRKRSEGQLAIQIGLPLFDLSKNRFVNLVSCDHTLSGVFQIPDTKLGNSQ